MVDGAAEADPETDALAEAAPDEADADALAEAEAEAAADEVGARLLLLLPPAAFPTVN